MTERRSHPDRPGAETRGNREAIADANRRLLRDRSVLFFQFAGAPGAGRTTLIGASLHALCGQVRAGVVMGDLAHTHDGEHLAEYCEQLVKLDTAALDAGRVRDALAHMDLHRLEWVLAEGVGVTCPQPPGGAGDGASQKPASFADLGQNLTVAVFGVAGGDDKPAATPDLVGAADAVVLTQLDLLPHVPFSLERFHEDVRRLNPAAEVFGLSALHGSGMKSFVRWLKRYRVCKLPPPADAGRDWSDFPGSEAGRDVSRSRGWGREDGGAPTYLDAPPLPPPPVHRRGDWYSGE